MFGKLFGGKKEPKINPEEQKKIEAKKNQFEIKKTKEDLERNIEQGQLKIENLERQIREKTKVI